MRTLLSSKFIFKKDVLALFYLALLFYLFLFSSNIYAQRNDGEFVVVLDAGHGGHDPGNLGNGYLEKNIALNIVLKAGAILERSPGVKVIYTRNDDTFIDLYVRGEIANKAKADLFVSVHCDSHTSNAYGAGTFVLGLHANKQNFEIAKKENSVIYLEDNYESRYADYDINSPESVIGLTIMQEEFLEQSIALAKGIQQNFSNKLKRKDRQVKQAGFIVLHQTFMPSVLVETGFLTNDKEGAYLNSKNGQSEMGTSIAEAILSYKGGVQNYSSSSSSVVVATKKETTPEVLPKQKTETAKPVKKAITTEEEFAKNPGANPITKKNEKIAEATKKLKKDIEATTEKITKNNEAEKETSIKQEVTLINEKPSKPKVSVAKESSNKPPKKVIKPKEDHSIVFKVQLMAITKEVALLPSNFGGLNKLSKEKFRQFYRYMYGNTSSFEQAKLLKSNADKNGYPTSYIVAYKDGVRILTQDALKLVSE